MVVLGGGGILSVSHRKGALQVCLFVFSLSKGAQKDLNYKFSYSPASSPSDNEHFLKWNKILLDVDLAYV